MHFTETSAGKAAFPGTCVKYTVANFQFAKGCLLSQITSTGYTKKTWLNYPKLASLNFFNTFRGKTMCVICFQLGGKI